jgi:hypothetical protein
LIIAHFLAAPVRPDRTGAAKTVEGIYMFLLTYK